MDTMEKSWPQYKSSEANALKASNLLTLRCRWEELLPGKNKLENEVKILVQNTDEYLLYSESFTYIDDELLNWLLVKATEDSVKDVEFFAIILIIKNGYIGNNYESIAKNYAYKAKNQYIIEQLMNYNIDTLCDYIACQKF